MSFCLKLISEQYTNYLVLLILCTWFVFNMKKGQGTFCSASWRGIQVAVKLLGEELFIDEDKMWVGCMPFLAFSCFLSYHLQWSIHVT